VDSSARLKADELLEYEALFFGVVAAHEPFKLVALMRREANLLREFLVIGVLVKHHLAIDGRKSKQSQV
jgi:hypothetical protein